jgi:hypothetical protein
MEWTVNGSAIVKDTGKLQIRVPISIRETKIPDVPNKKLIVLNI